MADPKEPNKCAKCSKPITMHSPSLCTFCEVAQYCSAQRRTDDFKSHRHHCNTTAKNLQLQALCARCPKVLKQDSDSSIGCDTCSAIFYCSSKCKDRNAEEHALFCKIYTDVRPRPSEAHRLHILFPTNEDKMPFIWLPNCQDEESRLKILESKVDPYGWGTEGFSVIGDDGNGDKPKFRVASGYHVKMFVKLFASDQNRSLGLVVNERPVSHFRGNIALAASSLTLSGGAEDLAPTDALPCDLPKLLQRLAMEEFRGGSKVKMELFDFDSDKDDESENGEEQ